MQPRAVGKEPMLAVLAGDWRVLTYRASIALLFGCAVLILPSSSFVLLFVLYTLADGIAALALSVHLRQYVGFGSVLLEGLVRVGMSFVVLAIARRSGVVLSMLLAAWAGLTGIGQIGTAMALRGEMAAEWPLPAAGILSMVITVLLLIAHPMDTRALTWMIGVYVLLWGITLVVFARRFRQLAAELQGTS